MKIFISKCVPFYNEIDNKLYCNSFEELSIEKILNMEIYYFLKIQLKQFLVMDLIFKYMKLIIL